MNSPIISNEARRQTFQKRGSPSFCKAVTADLEALKGGALSELREVDAGDSVGKVMGYLGTMRNLESLRTADTGELDLIVDLI